MRSQYWAGSRGVASPMCGFKSPLTPVGEGMEQGTGLNSYCHSTVNGKEDLVVLEEGAGSREVCFHG